ncbi:MAG TPA: EAL domain-containing protein [Zeimonas sp.]|nr:EAL domain-containing protein [Zeimonas sp.]
MRWFGLGHDKFLVAPARFGYSGADLEHAGQESDIRDAPAARTAQTRRETIALAAASIAVLAAALAASVAYFGAARSTIAAACGLAALAAAGSALVLALVRRRSSAPPSNGADAWLRSAKRQNDVERLAGLGSWIHDLQANTLHWSEGAFRLFGIDPASGVPAPKTLLAHIHPADQERWREAHRRAIKAGREVRVEFRWMRPNREVIWVRSLGHPEYDARGELVRMTGIVQDITGMRAMQQQLAASEAKFRDLTHLSSDWIWETDAQHRVSFLSDSIDAVLGSWARTMLGRRRWEIPENDFLSPDWETHRAICEAHKPFENFEFSQIDAQGNVRHLSLSGHPVYDDSGQFIGYRGVGRDITREKQQRMLLELEGDVAAIMREQTEPQRVITAILITVCGKLGWIGGVHLARAGRGLHARERWGYPAFTRAIAALPDEIPLDEGGIEEQCWRQGRDGWVTDLASYPSFVARYHTRAIGANAAFVAVLRDEHGRPSSLLLFLAPVAFRGESFLREVADMLSRTLSLYLQRQAAERRLTYASLHDALTGLPNRAHLLQQLDARLRAGQRAALLYVDLDRYKLINDTLGHSAGDQALIEVARRLNEAVGARNVVGRMGGDEFVALLSPPGTRDEVERLARTILASIERPLVLSNRAYFLSASIGVAFAPEDAADAQSLIRCADAAMYQVKSAGRNDVQFFAGGVSDLRAEQLQLVAELPQAILRGEIDLHYQPIMNIGERRVVGFEGLMRWRHPTRGLLMPDQFLPAAEQSHAIREIGLWTIRRALDDRVRLGIDAYPEVAVSVNVSARQLSEDGFLAALNESMLERRFPPRLLRLELTESAFIENPERTVMLIGELRRLGVRVIIDNFGTGYASLSYLKNLPVDGLKIDRAFVENLPEDRGNAAIVQAITAMAAKLGMQAMAEGVETAAELRELRTLDCDQVQGTLISEPLPFAELAEFLEALPTLRRMHLVHDADSVAPREA